MSIRLLSSRWIVLGLLAFAGVGNSLNYVGEWFTGGDIVVTGSLSIQNAVWLALLVVSLVAFLPSLIREVLIGERWSKVYGLFLLYSAVMILPASNQANAVRDFLQLAFPWLMYLLASRMIRTEPSGARSIIRAFWLGAVATGALTVVMALAGRSLFGTDYNGAIRFWGPMGWAGLGYYLLPYAFIAFAAILYRLSTARIAIFLAVMLPFLASLGRLSIAACVMGFVICFMFWRGNARNKLIFAFIGTAGAVSSAVLVAPYLIHRMFGDGGKMLLSGRDTASNYILSRLDMGIFQVLFGNGTGTARSITEELIGISAEIRSRYFVTFIDSGIFGSALLAASLALLMWSAIRELRILGRNAWVWKDGENSSIAPIQLAMAKVGCAIGMILIFAFDNLAFVYILSMYFVALAGCYWMIEAAKRESKAPPSRSAAPSAEG